MKILLVLPAIEKYRITKENPGVPDRKMLRFSILPLTMVAALTPPQHQVTICDENVEALDLSTDADVVAISFMSALAPRAYELAALFRKRGKTVVAGGYHPTLCPEETAAHFDATVVGDAEVLWPRVLEDIERGAVKGIYRHESSCSLDSTPAPRRDIIGGTSGRYATVYAVQCGRGCIHNCNYCSITAFHRNTYRARPVDAVLEELKTIPRDFIFVDDNIIADPSYARELFTRMAPLKKRWVSQCSLKLADDPELLRLARAAGCVGLFIGVETVSARNLASVNKGFNSESSIADRVRAIRRAGIGIIAGIIVGMDYDDVTVFETTMNFLRKVGMDAIQVNIFTPLPGTALHRQFRDAGRIADTDLAKYDFRHVVIYPSLMTRRELQDGADWLYRSFYRLDRIILRSLNALFLMGPAQALLSLKLGLTYRYDNRREGIVGRNPARHAPQPETGEQGLLERAMLEAFR